MPPIRIGFVGETGVGKSTIIDRLLGVNLLKSPAFGLGKNTASSKMIVELLPHADVNRQDYLFDFVIVPAETIRDWHTKAKTDAQYWRDHPDEDAPLFLRWFLRCFTHEEVSWKPSPSFAFEDHYIEELPKYQEFLEYYARQSSSFTKVTVDLFQTVFEDVKRFSPFIQQVSVFGPFHLLRALHVTLLDIPGTGFGIPPMATGEGGSWLMEERGRLAARMCQDIFFVADHRLTSSTASERSLLSLAMKCRNLYLIRTHACSLIHHCDECPSTGKVQGHSHTKYTPDQINRKLMEDLRHIKQDDRSSGSSSFAYPSMQMLLDRIGSRIFVIDNIEGDPTEGEEYDHRFDAFWQHFVDSLEIIYGNRYDRDVQRRVYELNALLAMCRVDDKGVSEGKVEKVIEEEHSLRELVDYTLSFEREGEQPVSEGGIDWLAKCCRGGDQQECLIPMHFLTANHEEFHRRIASACGHSHKILQSWLTYQAGYWHNEWYNSKMSELCEIVLSCVLPLEPSEVNLFNQSIQQLIDYFVNKVIRPQLMNVSSKVLQQDKILHTFVLRRCKYRLTSDLLDCFQGIKFFFVHRIVPMLMRRYGQQFQDHLRKNGPGCKQEMLKGLRNWFSSESQTLMETVIPTCIEDSLRSYFMDEIERVRDDLQVCLLQILLCRSLTARKQGEKASGIFHDIDTSHLNSLDVTCCQLLESRWVDLTSLYSDITTRYPALIPVIEGLDKHVHCPVKYTKGGTSTSKDREGIHLSGIEHCDLLFTQKPIYDVRIRCGRIERLHDKSAAFSTVGTMSEGEGEEERGKVSLCMDKQKVFASWSTVDAALVEGIVHHCLLPKSLSRTMDYFNCSLDLAQNLTDCVVRFVDENQAFVR